MANYGLRIFKALIFYWLAVSFAALALNWDDLVKQGAAAFLDDSVWAPYAIFMVILPLAILLGPYAPQGLFKRGPGNAVVNQPIHPNVSLDAIQTSSNPTNIHFKAD